MLALGRSLNYNLLELCEHNQTIHDIEELWLRRMNFRFVLPQLIHTVKGSLIILRSVKKINNSNHIIAECKPLSGCAHVPKRAQLAMIFGLQKVKR